MAEKMPTRRVMILDHPLWEGPRLWGWEAVEIARHPERGLIEVKLPWWTKNIFLPPECVSPVYNDCETCGYAAWGNVNKGSDKEQDWHHYCAWHLESERKAHLG